MYFAQASVWGQRFINNPDMNPIEDAFFWRKTPGGWQSLWSSKIPDIYRNNYSIGLVNRLEYVVAMSQSGNYGWSQTSLNVPIVENEWRVFNLVPISGLSPQYPPPNLGFSTAFALPNSTFFTHPGSSGGGWS